MSAKANIEIYVSKFPRWEEELRQLRKIILSTGLIETFKWGMPVFTNNENQNIVGCGGTKNFVGLWFFQGGLLKDKAGKLVNAQEGKTQAMRQWRFQNISEIEKESKRIDAYIQETIYNFNLGKKIIARKPRQLVIPNQLKIFLENNLGLNQKFKDLSLSQQREFADYVIDAKRPETKIRRLKKIKDLILNAKGLHDKYK